MTWVADNTAYYNNTMLRQISSHIDQWTQALKNINYATRRKADCMCVCVCVCVCVCLCVCVAVIITAQHAVATWRKLTAASSHVLLDFWFMDLQTKALFSSYGYFDIYSKGLFRILCSIICPHKLSIQPIPFPHWSQSGRRRSHEYWQVGWQSTCYLLAIQAKRSSKV